MTCPHCGFENPEGRKYCRGCAKALAATLDRPTDSPEADAPVTSPSISSSSIESSATDPFSTPPSPPGISRNIIAIAAVLVLLSGGLALWFIHKSNRDREAQASAAQNAANATHHEDSASLKNREHLMAALRLIIARQEARLADDPDDLNLCAVKLFGDDELGQHVRASRYIIDQECQPRTDDGRAIRNGFTVTATPKLEDNPADAPTYCVDQTKIIRRYADSNTVNNATSVQHLTCPLNGQPVQ